MDKTAWSSFISGSFRLKYNQSTSFGYQPWEIAWKPIPPVLSSVWTGLPKESAITISLPKVARKWRSLIWSHSESEQQLEKCVHFILGTFSREVDLTSCTIQEYIIWCSTSWWTMLKRMKVSEKSRCKSLHGKILLYFGSLVIVYELVFPLRNSWNGVPIWWIWKCVCRIAINCIK